MMGLTACSEKQANVENPMLTEADAMGLGENVVETINLYVQQNAKDQITDAVLCRQWKAGRVRLRTWAIISELSVRIQISRRMTASSELPWKGAPAMR